MNNTLRSLEKFVTDATAVGVTETSLKPFTDLLNRGSQFHTIMEQVDALDPVGDALANGGDLTAALKAEAENEAVYARAEAHADHMQATARITAGTLMEDSAVADAIINDLAAALAPHTAAIDKIVKRWGDENPDPAVVLAEATATELKDYRDRVKHINARDQIRTLVNAFLVDAPYHTRSSYDHFPIVSTGNRLYKEPWMWLINDDGKFLTSQEARAHINARETIRERSSYNERKTSPRPPYLATYAVSPEALDTATFQSNGRPTEGTPLMSDKEYVELFGDTSLEKGTTGNTTEQRAYLDKLESIASGR